MHLHYLGPHPHNKGGQEEEEPMLLAIYICADRMNLTALLDLSLTSYERMQYSNHLRSLYREVVSIRGKVNSKGTFESGHYREMVTGGLEDRFHCSHYTRIYPQYTVHCRFRQHSLLVRGHNIILHVLRTSRHYISYSSHTYTPKYVSPGKF